ncbi:MAG: hypothetical protein D4S01_10340 [Dehalococcoidia bacterium]|nr:MAG: hypothetical protein D4S01_10340 [Dehalococcoidia bacterium]
MNKRTLNGVVEGLVDFCSSQESSIVNLRRQLKSLTETELKAQIPEDRFNCLRLGRRERHQTRRCSGCL